MDFYHAPGSCSQATHIMLHEATLDFRPHTVDLVSHTLADGSDYTRINPNGYVPAVVFDDGSLLTESVAILDWLTGWANALPSGDEIGRRRHLQVLAFMSSELHKPFIPLFFTEDDEEQAGLRETLEPRLGWIGTRVQGAYLFGDHFTGADAMLYVMLRWAELVGVAYPDELNGFIKNAEGRRSVRSVLADENLQPLRALP